MRPIRVAVYGAGSALSTTTTGRTVQIQGSTATLMNGFWASVMKNFSWIPTPTTEEFGQSIGNGSHNGLLGFLEQDKADIGYFVHPLALYDTVGTSSALYDTTGKVLQMPERSSTSLRLVDSLFVYAMDVYLCSALIGLLLAFLVTLKQKHSCRFLIESFVRFLDCYIGQANIHCFSEGSKTIICLYLIFAFVVAQVFTQALNAELTAKDYSHVITHLKDINRFNDIRAYFGRSDNHMSYYMSSSDPVFTTFFKRRNTFACNIESLVSKAFGERDTKDVFVGVATGMDMISSFLCKPSKDILWSTSKGTGRVVQSFYTSLHMEAKIKKFIDYRVMLTADSGTARGFIRNCATVTMGGTQKSDLCERHRLEDLYDEDDLKSISLKHASLLINLYYWCLALFILIFIMEPIFGNRQKVKAMSEAMLNWVVLKISIIGQLVISNFIRVCHYININIARVKQLLWFQPGN